MSNKTNASKHGLRICKGQCVVNIHRDGSVFVRLFKSNDALHFDNTNEFTEYVAYELAEWIAKNPWHRNFTDAEQILSTIR